MYKFKRPSLLSVEHMLKGVCELPLRKDERKVDKSKKVIKLNNDAYTRAELSVFIQVLNAHKKEILAYAFTGNNEVTKPNYLCGVEYVKKHRTKLTIYKINDVINSLSCFDFKIRPSGTVVSLDKCFSIQRKGGDGGKASSNQIQFKLIFSKLNLQNKIEYIFPS